MKKILEIQWIVILEKNDGISEEFLVLVKGNNIRTAEKVGRNEKLGDM